ncbi:MAG: hydantoin racemase [Deltaproteobacteria bacterium]|nr:hydantoin racemase [Deltaproteobacteria bacterium]
MKICIVNINEESVSGPYTELLIKNFNRIKREDTVLGWKYVKALKRATDTVMSYFIQLNKTEIIEGFYEADQEGYDGAMVACSGDPGVYEAQEITKIPIVGPMEAALFLACMQGYKFGIVTVADRRWAEYCEDMTVRYGIRGRLSGIERIAVPSIEAFTKGFLDLDWIGQELLDKSRKLVEAGANSVVIGSAGLSTMASAAQISKVPEYDAPIFDCLSVGLKMTELRVDLQKKAGLPPVSRVGAHEMLKEKDIRRVRSLFNMK